MVRDLARVSVTRAIDVETGSLDADVEHDDEREARDRYGRRLPMLSEIEAEPAFPDRARRYRERSMARRW